MMRFVNMMNRLEQDIAWPYAVLVLEPMANTPWNWPEASNIAVLPDTIGGNLIAAFLREAPPLPSEAISKSFSIEACQYKYAQEERDEKDWPAGLPQLMPIFILCRIQNLLSPASFARCLKSSAPDAPNI